MNARPHKNSSALTTRLSGKSRTLGFPSSDYSEFGFNGIFVEEIDLLACNDGAKRSLIVKPIDFKGFIER
jgi:hypothetical protein